jgi:hypothetical protein
LFRFLFPPEKEKGRVFNGRERAGFKFQQGVCFSLACSEGKKRETTPLASQPKGEGAVEKAGRRKSDNPCWPLKTNLKEGGEKATNLKEGGKKRETTARESRAVLK